MKSELSRVVLVASLTAIAVFLVSVTSIVSAEPIAYSFQFPVDDYCSSDGCREWGAYTSDGRRHLGDDFCAPVDTPVNATADGIVKFAKKHGICPNWGYLIIIEHTLPDNSKVCTLYGHVKPTVAENSIAYKGTKVGTIAHLSCWSDHIHFAVYNGPYGTTTGIYPTWAAGYTSQANWPKADPCAPICSDYLDPIEFINSRSASADSWHFNTSSNTEGWEDHNTEGDRYSVERGRYFINPKRDDPWIQIDGLSLDANKYNAIEINMASNCPDGNGRIYFTTASSPGYSDNKMVEFKVDNNGNWNDHTIYMANHNSWQGEITGLRIDPAEHGISGTNSDTVGFDWIRMINTNKEPSIIDKAIPSSANPGEAIYFEYWIHNPFANGFSGVRLGAQIRENNPQRTWIDDPANDVSFILGSGTYVYARLFEIPASAKLTYYDAHWVILKHSTGIWFDDKEKLNAILIMPETSTLPVIAPDPTPTPTPTPTLAPTPPGCP